MQRRGHVRRIGACVILLPFALAGCARAQDGDDAFLRVMSFNVRYGTADDGENRWALRRDLVAETVAAFDPDLLGVQECLEFQGAFLRDRLPEYEFIGVGRDDGKSAGEMCAVLYRTDRFDKTAEGHFWLSETPDVPGSKSWDAALTRMVTWARLRDLATNREFTFVNTHFDHRGTQARLESARLLHRKVLEIADGAPFIITGDFNAPARDGPDEPYRALVRDASLEAAPVIDTYRSSFPAPAPLEGTFGGFTGDTDGPRIDWILVSRHYQVVRAGIDRHQREGRYPSDHYPVIAVLRSPPDR